VYIPAKDPEATNPLSALRFPPAVISPLVLIVAAFKVPVKVGEADSTTSPEPVEVVTPVPPLATDKVPVVPATIGNPVQLVRVPELGVPNAPPFVTKAPALPTFTAKAVATFAPNPLTPVEIGSPVQLVKVPEAGVPRAGVTSVGDVAKTNAPEPVSLVTAAAKLALLGVAKNVATPVPNPLTPVEIGSPMQLVKVPELGVPRAGVTNVGEVAKTSAPEPVSSDTAAAICAEVAVNVLLDKFIVLLVSVSVVALPTKVSVEVGNVNVPVLTIELITGVASVGDVPNTSAPDPVSPVTAAAKLALLGVAKNVATLAPNPLIPPTGIVQLVNVPELGVPSAPPLTTKAPALPTLTANAVATLVPNPLTPVEMGNPVQLVKVPEVGVPNAGVTSVKDSA
jgi:hypothetical protein